MHVKCSFYNELNTGYIKLGVRNWPPNCHQYTSAPDAPSLRAAALHARASVKHRSGSNRLVNDED